MTSRTPLAKTMTLYLIAAEESGDRLGARLMREIRDRRGDTVRFEGIGGSAMAAEGLTSLFPIARLSIVGIGAVLKALPSLLKLIDRAVQGVLSSPAAALVIIDSPDFTQRVARRVHAKRPSLPIINYVSPSVWAWRSGRARAMRGYVDHVLALLPFEPQAHRDLGGPPCTYIGHPLIEQLQSLRPNADEQTRREASPAVLLVLPGSRGGELRYHMPIFGETLARLRDRGLQFEAVLPTMPHLADRVADGIQSWPVRPRIVEGEPEKRAAFRIAHAALAKSGTVTLELALAQVPMITAYQVGRLERFVAKRLIRVSSAILANLVIGENVVPEFLGDDCTAANLAPALHAIMTPTSQRARQVEAFRRLDAIMMVDPRSPSAKAADIVLDLADQGRTSA